MRAAESGSCPRSQWASLQPHRRYCAPRPAARSGVRAHCRAHCSWEGHTCARARRRVCPHPGTRCWLREGTGVTVLPASHLPGDPTASERSGPAELTADSGRGRGEGKPAIPARVKEASASRGPAHCRSKKHIHDTPSDVLVVSKVSFSFFF